MTDSNEWNARDEHPSGQETSDNGEFLEQLEGSIESFSSGRASSFDEPAVESESSIAVQGPGGDSRPDLIDPKSATFDDITDDPQMTTSREGHGPEIHRLDPQMLEQQLADTEDEIVAHYDGGPNATEGQQLRPRHHEDKESSQL